MRRYLYRATLEASAGFPLSADLLRARVADRGEEYAQRDVDLAWAILCMAMRSFVAQSIWQDGDLT